MFFKTWRPKELILLVFQSKLSQSLKAEIFLRALESVTPQFFYTVKVSVKPVYVPVHFHFALWKKNHKREQYAPLKYNNLLKDVVDALGPKLGSADYEAEVNAIAKNYIAFQKHPKSSQEGKHLGSYILLLPVMTKKENG